MQEFKMPAKIRFPHNISFHTEKNNGPFANPIVKQQIKAQYKGVISKDGKWLGPPIAEWKIELIEPGYVRLNHRHGFDHYSVSYSALGAIARIRTLKMDNYITDIIITDSENKPTNIDFAICVSRTAYMKS